MNFCKDCRHSFTGQGVYWCVNQNVSDVNRVTGKLDGVSCNCERSNLNGKCGIDGKVFEPKYTLKQKFIARLNWCLNKDFDAGALK